MVKTIASWLYLLCGLITTINATGINVELPQNYQIERVDYQQIRKLQSLSLEFTQYFQNRTAKDLDIFNTRVPNKDDLQCMADMGRWMNDLTSGRLWSMKSVLQSIGSQSKYKIQKHDLLLSFDSDRFLGLYTIGHILFEFLGYGQLW